MATPHAFRTHAHEQFRFDPLPSGRTRNLRSGLLIGATSVALTFTVLPGTAAADPTEATTPGQATQLVAEASHELEVRWAELVQKLADEPAVTIFEREQFRQLCQLIEATIHHEYRSRLDELPV